MGLQVSRPDEHPDAWKGEIAVAAIAEVRAAIQAMKGYKLRLPPVAMVPEDQDDQTQLRKDRRR